MHEYSLMQGVIRTILDDLKEQGIRRGECVKEVTLRVGALDVHSEESLRQAYDALSKGTILEGSHVNLVIVPAHVECPACGYTGPYPKGPSEEHTLLPFVECPGCGEISKPKGGMGVESIELLTVA